MPKHRQEVAGSDGWSRWVHPIMEGYRASCCDCGLVHELEFRVCDDEPARIEFRARLHNRATGQVRRHMK